MKGWIGFVAAACTLLTVAAASAQGTELRAPDEIVIYVHKDLKNDDFVEGLVCELGRVLVSPVRATTSDLPLSRSYLATPTQLDTAKVAAPFLQATAGDSGRIFRYLIQPYDLQAPGLNYLFSHTFTDGRDVVVMSTIRLEPKDVSLSRKRISDITGDRLYKLMLKSVAMLAGLRTNGCVMAFPRSLPELDAKAAEFCPEDRAALVAADILKDKPYGACSTVAMARP